MNSSSVIDSSVNAETLSSEPYTQTLPEMMALPREQVLVFNLDVLAAAIAVRGNLPEIRALQEEIKKTLPMCDATCIDKLERYAAAANYAHMLHVTACEGTDELPVLHEEAVSTRDTFQADLAALAARGFINPTALRQYSGLSGYKNVAKDLLVQLAVLKANWKNIQGKTCIKAEEMDRADRLVTRITRAIGLRDQTPPTMASTAELQARAMTLLVNCYDEVRRAVSFLRWDEGDADRIAPSLYANNKRKAQATPEPPVAQPAPAAAQPAGAPTAVKPLNVPVPGSNPFMS